MQLWTAAVLFIVCAGAAVIFIKFYGKNKKKRFIVLTVIVSLLVLAMLTYSGLTFILIGGVSDAPPESAIVTDVPATPDTGETDPAIVKIDAIIDEAIAIINAGRRDNFSNVTFEYEPKLVYDNLSGDDKAMYDEMLQKARTLIPFFYTAAEHGYDVMDKSLVVFGALNKDHPEIENYFMLCEVVDGDMVTTAIEALYFMPRDAGQKPAGADALREETERFNAVCERIVKRIPEDFSAYDKYRYLAVVISLATSYDYDKMGGWQVSTAYGSIIGGYSICQGYSRGFMYLCRKANLWCVTVDGVAGENDSHMWNLVKLDSGTYHIDVTWCDELGFPDSPEWESYFMLTQNEILKDHEITDGTVATGT